MSKKQPKPQISQNKELIEVDQIRQSQWPYDETDLSHINNSNAIQNFKKGQTNNNFNKIDDRIEINKIQFKPSNIQLQKNIHSSEGSQEQSEELQIMEENKKGNIQNLQIKKPQGDSLKQFNSKDYTIEDVTKNGQTSYHQLLKRDVDQRAAKLFSIQNTKKQQIKQREKEKNRKDDQQYELQFNKISNQIVSGNLAIVWVFILKNLQLKYVQKIKEIHAGYQKKDYIIPYFDNMVAAKQILNKTGCGFKILVDLDNAQKLAQMKEYLPKIISIYLYNNDRVKGVLRCLQLKKKTKKIRITYVDLNPIFAKAQKQIQDASKFVRADDGTLEQIKFKSKLPAFMKLSGQDKTQATSYRTNLYGAIKLEDQRQRKQKLKRFVEYVQRKYLTDSRELDHLQEYQKINHVVAAITAQKSFKILQFYVKESFYYRVVNSTLRIAKSIEQFKPITIPFNETYHAIKYYHELSLHANNNFTQQLVLYRGAPLNRSDFKALQPGNFVELLGFISTSKSYEKAKGFLDRKDSYMLVFRIKKMEIKKNLKIFDHGYVDINMYDIAEKHFKQEQELILNAMNVYKITKIQTQQQNEDGINTIYLDYGAIFELYQKKQQDLTESEIAVLANYRYCAKLSNQIQDHGDILLKAHEYDKCKDYYKQKINRGEQNTVNYNKLANAHHECGELDEAYQNALKSLEKYQKMSEEKDQGKRMKIIQIHQKNANILGQYEDYKNAQKGLNFNLQLLTDEDWLLKAKTLRQIGFLLYKEGNIKQSQKVLEDSERIILDRQSYFERKRGQIQRKFFFKYIMGCCCFANTIQLDEQKQFQLEEVKKLQKEMKKMNQQIKEVLIEIRNNMRELAQSIGDRKKVQECIKKAQSYSLQLPSASQTDDPFKKAKINVIEARIQNSLQTISSVTQSYKLMQMAIELIQAIQPMHQKVGQYSKLLGNMKQKQFTKKNLVPSKNRLQNILNRNQQTHLNQMKIYPMQSNQINETILQQKRQEHFNYQQYDQNYLDCRTNYQKAIMVISNNKGQQVPQVFEIRNHLGEIQYQYSHYKQSEEEVSVILGSNKGNLHTEGAKAALLLAKISVSKGELKFAFKDLQKAITILKRAVIKNQNQPAYKKTYELSPVYIQIQLWRCKIYNRQLKHDLALTNIQKLKKIAKKKLEDPEGVGYLSGIYQEQAQSLVALGDYISFQEYFLKAITQRQNQMGQFNIPNGISKCNMFRYMLLMGDLESAQSYLDEATKIFSHFSVDHPNSWIIFLSNSLLKDYQHKQEQSQNLLKQSVRIIQRKYAESHITLLKVKFKYAQLLSRCSKFDEAMNIFQFLQRKVTDDLRISQIKQVIESQLDDQKVGLRKTLAQSIRSTNNHKKSTKNFTSFKILSNQQLIKTNKQIPVASNNQNKFSFSNNNISQSQNDLRQLIQSKNILNSNNSEATKVITLKQNNQNKGSQKNQLKNLKNPQIQEMEQIISNF